jgi:UDP-N-acetylmuramate--alanine ligase
MTDIASIDRVYMLGIGGIGMSALARYFKKRGAVVSGYDKTPSPLTEALSEEGIQVYHDEETEAIPSEALFVYTPAIPKEHPAFDYVRSSGGIWLKRSEVLELITAQTHTIAIAGTHGKTTTTAITAHVLHTARGQVSAFVGGIMSGYESNLIAAENPEVVVVEADEYDRSFLRLHPDLAIITSLDPDHLDIYGTFEEMKKDYRSFAASARKLIVHERVAHEFEHPDKTVYGTRGDVSYGDVSVDQGAFCFSVNRDGGYRLSLPGRHNVENATAAIAVSMELGLDAKSIKAAIASFAGVKRRFERVFQSSSKVIIDDYAHHPAEIKAAIQAARELYPERTIAVVFQPHLYSRTRDLEDGFVESLSEADEVVLMPIYAARELPIDGVSSANLLKKLPLKTKHLVEKTDLILAVLSLSADVVLILGAGDIDRFVQPIAEAFRKRTYVE